LSVPQIKDKSGLVPIEADLFDMIVDAKLLPYPTARMAKATAFQRGV